MKNVNDNGGTTNYYEEPGGFRGAPPSGNGFMGIVFRHLILMETGEYKMLGIANVTRPKCNFILFDLILLISVFSFVCFILVYFPFLIYIYFLINHGLFPFTVSVPLYY